MITTIVYALAVLGVVCVLCFLGLAVIFVLATNHEDRSEHQQLRDSSVPLNSTAWYGPIVPQPIASARREAPLSLFEFPAADQAVLREVAF